MDVESVTLTENCKGNKLNGTGQLSLGPPQYCVSDPADPFNRPAPTLEQQVRYSGSQSHTVMVPMLTQPVYVNAEKAQWTTCALVMSTLGAIFCGFFCGAAGIVFAWKARMQNLQQKYQHARHSVCVAWIFFAIAFWFGLIIWALVAWVCIITFW